LGRGQVRLAGERGRLQRDLKIQKEKERFGKRLDRGASKPNST